MNAQAWTDAIGLALLHFLWQGIVAAAVLPTAFGFIRAASARYRLSAIILFILPLLPVFTAIHFIRTDQVVAPPIMRSDQTTMSTNPMPSPRRMSANPTRIARHTDPMSWVVNAWAAGAVVLESINAAGWMRVRRLTRIGVAPAARVWQRPLIDLMQRQGVRGVVRLLESSAIATPAVIGHFRPVILLPVALAAGLSVTQVEMILAHELSHIRRWDYLANLAQAVVETLLFYHPAVWWISRQMRREREACCDEAAVNACGGDRVSYARTLLDLEDYRMVPQPAVGAATLPLAARVHRLIGIRRPWQAGPAMAAFIVIVGCLALPLMTLRLRAAASEPTTDIEVIAADGKPAADARLTVLRGEDDDVAAEVIFGPGGIAHVPLSALGKTGERTMLLAEAPGSAVTIQQFDPSNLTMHLGQTTSVTVKFVDSAHHPVAGVSVSPILLFNQPSSGAIFSFTVAKPPPAVARRLSRKTDSDGSVTFSEFCQTQHVRLDVDDARFAQLDASSDLALSQSPTSATSTIELLAAATLRGTVKYGSSGKPAPGIRIEAQGVALNSGWGDCVTDDHGRYELGRMRPGIYNIALDLAKRGLDADWTAAALAGIVVHPGDQTNNLDLSLIPGVTVQGTAIDGASGKPIAGADIGIYGPAHPSSSAWVQSATSDASGHFTARVPPGEQYIYVMGEKEGYFSPSGVNLMALDGRPLAALMKFTANPNQPCVGHVYMADGKPAAGAEVEVEELGRESFMQLSTRADNDGRYQFDHLGDGTLLRARSGDQSTAAAVRITQSNRANVRLELTGAATTLHVKITNSDGQAIAGATIELSPYVNGGSSVEEHHGGSDGRYTFTAVFPDYKYSLIAYADGYEQVQEPFEPFKMGGDREQPVTLKPATSFIAGQIVNRAPPLNGIHIRMTGGVRVENTITDAQGRFRFDHEAAGARFSLNGDADGLASAQAFAKAPADDVKIRFPVLASAATQPIRATTHPKLTGKLGAGLSDLSHFPDLQNQAAYGGGNVTVQAVLPGSRAEAMGLSIGDTIKKVNGKDVKKPTDVVAAVRTGEVLTIEIQRGQQTLTLTEPNQ